MTRVSAKLLEKINGHPISREDMRAYLGALSVSDEPPSFAHCVEAGMAVFDGDTAKCLSLNVRLEALNRILASGQLHGWIQDTEEEDCFHIPENIFMAAGVTPLVVDGVKLSFEKDALVKAAFQMGKAKQANS